MRPNDPRKYGRMRERVPIDPMEESGIPTDGTVLCHSKHCNIGRPDTLCEPRHTCRPPESGSTVAAVAEGRTKGGTVTAVVESGAAVVAEGKAKGGTVKAVVESGAAAVAEGRTKGGTVTAVVENGAAAVAEGRAKGGAVTAVVENGAAAVAEERAKGGVVTAVEWRTVSPPCLTLSDKKKNVSPNFKKKQMIIPTITAILGVTCQDIRSSYHASECCSNTSRHVSYMNTSSVCSSQPGASIFSDLVIPFVPDSDASLHDAFNVSSASSDASVKNNLRMLEGFAAMYNKSVLHNGFVDTFFDRETSTFSRSVLEVEHDLLQNLDTFYDIEGDLNGTLAVLFGATGGYGLSVAVSLATMGASVVVTGRSQEHFDMSMRMMGMSSTDLQTHCVDAQAFTTTPPPVSKDRFTVDGTTPVPEAIWNALNHTVGSESRFLVPQECDPSYSGPLHVPQSVQDRISFVKSDVRIVSQVTAVLTNLPQSPKIVGNFACSVALNSSPLLSKEYNQRTMKRNFGLDIDFDAATISNDTAIIELTPDVQTTRFGAGLLYDSFHLTTVKGTNHILTAMHGVYPNVKYTFAEGSSFTQFGLGWTKHLPVYYGLSLLNYMATKKVSQQVLWNEMQYGLKEGSINVAHSFAYGMKTSNAISSFHYEYASAVLMNRPWDKWVIYLRDSAGRVKAFLPTNHQETLQLIHHYHLLNPGTSTLPSSVYYGKLQAKAMFDAHIEDRSLTRFFPILMCMPNGDMTDMYDDYATGIANLIGTEFTDAMKHNSKLAIFNDRVWEAFHRAYTFLTGGTHDVGIPGVKLEFVSRRIPVD